MCIRDRNINFFMNVPVTADGGLTFEDGIRDRSPSRGLGDVYKRQPKAWLRDYTVTALLDKHYTDGVFKLKAELAGASAAGEIAVTLFDGEREVFSRKAKIDGSAATIDGVLPKVRAWSAETPNLYRMLIEYLDADGKLVSATSRRIGFRTVEMLSLIHI